jgi:hypothetical protein
MSRNIPRTPVLHRLASGHADFEASLCCAKQHELRPDPQEGFAPGDAIVLVEQGADGVPTGRELVLDVTYVTSASNPCALSPGNLSPGYSVLSVRRAAHAVA